MIKWLVKKLEEYGIYPIEELQTWGHCGCCGSPISDEIFPKVWAWGLCKRCKEGVKNDK